VRKMGAEPKGGKGTKWGEKGAAEPGGKKVALQKTKRTTPQGRGGCPMGKKKESKWKKLLLSHKRGLCWRAM